MLAVHIKYKVDAKADGSPRYETFEVTAADTSSTMYLRISTASYNAVDIMAGIKDSDGLWSRRVNIGLSTVKVETSTHVNEAGKNVKDEVNYDFFCRLAAVIRFAKSKCQKKYAVGFTGLQTASGAYVPESETTYDIPMDVLGGGTTSMGQVCLCLGEIKKMHITTPDFVVDIEDDPSLEQELFLQVKNGVPKGFKFDAEYLGFYVAPIITQAVNTSGGLYTCLEDVIRNNPDKEYQWLLEKNYHIVSDDTLQEVFDAFMACDDYVYYDTETSGLNITFKSRIGQGDQLVGVVLSMHEGESYFFPTQMKSVPNLCGGDHFYFMERYMRPILEGKKLVAHNMAFDWKVSYIYDINANIVHDTMALFKLTLGAERENFPIGLKALAKMFLNRDSLELSDFVVDDSWGDSDIKFWDLPYELVRLYANADTDNTRGLLQYALSQDLLHKYGAQRVYDIEIAFSYATAYQEFMGHKIDTENLETLHAEIDAGIAANMAKMVDIVGHEFNPNSPPQLLQIMYGSKEDGGLGIPEQISRKTNRPTTDKETLKALAELTDINDEIMYPFVHYLQEFRKYEGIRKILDQFGTYATEDGYLFSQVQQYGTTTGRVSINKPNYQSYNDPVKKNIIPRPGYYMTDTDYSSVEYRVLGNMAGNQMIKDGFVDPDFDYHAYQAARMYSVPYAAVTKSLRKAAKGINFGLPYGMGDQSLGVRVFGEESEENTRKAAALRKKYFEGQEDIADFFETARTKGVVEGFTETYFGRRRYYHKNKFTVNQIRRQSGNQVIQGCLDGDTRIQTRELGIVKLKDVAGYSFDVWDGDKWSNGDVMYSGKKQKCIIKFKGGQSIVCSPIHKFLVRSSKGNDRFVECKDLKGAVDYRNPHRVVINKKYEPSDYCYSSKDAYKYKGFASNSKNVYLDNIGRSFDIGVVLGRLASDGSYDVREDGGSYIKQFVAEHEYSILPELRSCMESLGFIERNNDVREGRNQRMTHLSVYSNTLANEVDDLDIKHQVHDNIFMDTEVLRGFLSGFFDGDGGVSGKTIALTFGTQYDFEPMCLDLQKALLFFGIRSRYRKYNDRYVIQIKTNDNKKFLDTIGFLNQDKQDKGNALKCVEDEHIFGECLVVESVEITDEYIDMYDVCNTDDGYFVADGIITHNTAADIYKLAVGRLFKRICKEGWLGKVLLTGFIHDEVLCEVHESIDPMIWLKVLREEFEVKIEGWCPLYMGFGFGMSWYEAKSVELPIKLQWELVEKYGENGYDKWNGSGKELCASIPDILRDFSVRDTINQLHDEESQGKPIKPTLNNALSDVLDEDLGIYNKVLSKYRGIEDLATCKEDIERELRQNYITGLMVDTHGYLMRHVVTKKYAKGYESVLSDFIKGKPLGVSDTKYIEDNKDEVLEKLAKKGVYALEYDSEGAVLLKLSAKRDTQQAITDFSALHCLERENINLLNIEDVVVSQSALESSEVSMGYDFDDAFGGEDAEGAKRRNIDTRVSTFGMYLDTDDMEVILKLMPKNYLDFIRAHCNMENRGYRVIFKNEATGDFHRTESFLTSEEVRTIQDMYLMYFKQLASA